jgi:hypothetical protein
VPGFQRQANRIAVRIGAEVGAAALRIGSLLRSSRYRKAADDHEHDQRST